MMVRVIESQGEARLVAQQARARYETWYRRMFGEPLDRVTGDAWWPLTV